jgi:hypothetical protein
VGLLIDNRDLAQEVVRRFDAMVSPDAAYRVVLNSDSRGHPHLRWTTQIDRAVEFSREPSRGFWQRAKVEVLRLLPLDREL